MKMSDIFLKILGMSIAGGYLALAVMILRLLLKKAPKWVNPALWGIVGLRLVMPFSIKSAFSLMPRAVAGEEDIPAALYRAAETAAPILKRQTAHGLVNGADAKVLPGVNAALSGWEIAAFVWLAGVFLMLAYAAAGCLRLAYRMKTAVRLADQDRICRHADSVYVNKPERGFAYEKEKSFPVYQSEQVSSPFVLGMIRPKIYLPFSMSKEHIPYVTAHEKAHIKRKDHLWKLFGFFLLSLYWFHPLLWISYILLCRDMEAACDEKVIKTLSPPSRAAYSQALLACSAPRNFIAACPLSFGETGVKTRVKQILHYRRPAIWASAAAGAVCIAAALCFLTSPQDTTRTDSKNPPAHSIDEAEESGASKDMESQTGINGEQGDLIGDTESSAGIGGKQREAIEEAVQSWARAFTARDGNAIASLASDTLKEYLSSEDGGDLLYGEEGNYGFGFSSPWPWNDYFVYDYGYGNNEAIIYYYAMVSDPHVTVWKETLEYEETKDGLRFTGKKLRYFDAIASGMEYEEAYPEGISGTPMDYTANGLGESLNENALLSGNTAYQSLFTPESAAASLLNLLNNPRKIELSRREEPIDGAVRLQLHFLEDGKTFFITMIQPYGEGGIWIPIDSMEA